MLTGLRVRRAIFSHVYENHHVSKKNCFHIRLEAAHLRIPILLLPDGLHFVGLHCLICTWQGHFLHTALRHRLLSLKWQEPGASIEDSSKPSPLLQPMSVSGPQRPTQQKEDVSFVTLHSHEDKSRSWVWDGWELSKCKRLVFTH